MQVTQLGLGNNAGDTSLLKLEFGYGDNTQNNGSMRSQKISFNGLAQPFEQTYAYDALNRLQSATETVNNGADINWKQSFSYDRFGNRRFDANNTTNFTSNDVTNPLINTSDNRFSANQGYAYDKSGNLINDANGKKFAYDAESHQKEVRDVSNNVIGTYLYDGEGKRVKKISATETTVFVYDGGGQLVAEYSTQQSATPQISYLTDDHLGSARIITNQSGQVVARKDYGAFGDEIGTSQRTQALKYQPQNIRQDYTGYEKDDESGLEFAQARYYNTLHGRFTSVDPLTASANMKDPQTFNRYSYGLNSPYKFTDPLGLIYQGAGGGGGFCSAENSSCADGGEEITTRSEEEYRQRQAQPLPANQHEASQAPQEELTDAQIKAMYPIFNSNDQEIVNQAIQDAANSVTSGSFFGTILMARFRRVGDGTMPEQAIDALDATMGVNITRDPQTKLIVGFTQQNIYDGRKSTLLVKDDDGTKVTASQYFKDHRDVTAFTYDGYVFLGQGFFNKDRDGRAKTMVHEGIVHKGFGRDDREFDKSGGRTEGSHAINAIIDTYYRRLGDRHVETTTNIPGSR